MSHAGKKFTIYHFSLHNEHSTYGLIHKQYKENTCEYLYLFPIYLLAYIFMSYLPKQWRAVHGHRILCLMSGFFLVYIIFPCTMNMTHTGFYINNTKKRHVNIYSLFLSISYYTYLCPNSQNSGALYTGIEFYVSCQEFFWYISIFLTH